MAVTEVIRLIHGESAGDLVAPLDSLLDVAIDQLRMIRETSAQPEEDPHYRSLRLGVAFLLGLRTRLPIGRTGA